VTASIIVKSIIGCTPAVASQLRRACIPNIGLFLNREAAALDYGNAFKNQISVSVNPNAATYLYELSL